MSDQPERCPTCTKRAKELFQADTAYERAHCPDPWHTSAPPEPTAASQATPSAKQFYSENAALVERVFDTFDTKGKSTLYVDRDLLVQVLSIKDKNAASQVSAAIKGTTSSTEQWRVGRSVPINVYEGDRPVCQCHTSVDAERIVEAVNAALGEAKGEQGYADNSIS